MVLRIECIPCPSHLFEVILQNEQKLKRHTCKKEKHCRFCSFHGSIMLPGNGNHSTRKLLTDSMLMEVSVCYRLITHNNGNLWFTFFNSLFTVSSMLNGNALFILHFKGLVTSCCLWRTSNTPHRLQKAQEPSWEIRDQSILHICPKQ